VSKKVNLDEAEQGKTWLVNVYILVDVKKGLYKGVAAIMQLDGIQAIHGYKGITSQHKGI
jgi:hypothetical protein